MKRKYMIQWQPVGGKPGGCITANADGTYSTPICNSNINKQQWFIKKINDEEEYLKVIPKDRREMGRSMDETDFPFHIVQSTEFEQYCLHYEGGGLAIREIANYDSQKWDISKDKIYQESLPTQENNKFTGLTPGHKMSATDKSLSALGQNGNGSKESSPMQFNINLDPDLLQKMGINTGLPNLSNSESNGLGGGENSMGGSNSVGGGNSIGGNSLGDGGNSLGRGGNSRGGNTPNDLLLTDEEKKEKMKNKKVNEMMIDYNGNEEICKDCNKIPDNMIKKDLVKSVCIGCNNIDNVLE